MKLYKRYFIFTVSWQQNPEEEIKNPVVLFEALNLVKCEYLNCEKYENCVILILCRFFSNTDNELLEFNVTDDLFDSLSLGCYPSLPTNLDLFLLCSLCNLSDSSDLWTRLHRWSMASSQLAPSRRCRLLIWLLVGIRLTDDEINIMFKSVDSNLIDYLQNNLTKLFTKACRQNLPFL